jgi:hypothetical protein
MQAAGRSSRAAHNTLLAVVHDHAELEVLAGFAAKELVGPGGWVPAGQAGCLHGPGMPASARPPLAVATYKITCIR